MTFKDKNLLNKDKAEIYKRDYKDWKKLYIDTKGWIPIFNTFKDDFLLRELSGNAVKLYLYLGLHAKNETGECWVAIDTMAKYFDKSPRTISGWIKELENAHLIKRMQFEKNGVSYTFLRPY